MQSRFARGPQLCVRFISVISELYFVASGSVLSRVIYFLLTMAQPTKQVRTLHDQLKIIEEVEKNPGEKRVDIANQLGLAASTLYSPRRTRSVNK
jgi:predicted transcriptional regulator